MLQPLSVLADAGRVGTTSRLEPINLKILRRTRVMPFSFLVLSAAALWITGLVSSGELRPRLLGLAVIATGYAVIAVIAWIVAGEEGRWLRLDNEGVTVHGDCIPWEAVMSAQWSVGAVLNETPPTRHRASPPSGRRVSAAPIGEGVDRSDPLRYARDRATGPDRAVRATAYRVRPPPTASPVDAGIWSSCVLWREAPDGAGRKLLLPLHLRQQPGHDATRPSSAQVGVGEPRRQRGIRFAWSIKGGIDQGVDLKALQRIQEQGIIELRQANELEQTWDPNVTQQEGFMLDHSRLGGPDVLAILCAVQGDRWTNAPNLGRRERWRRHALRRSSCLRSPTLPIGGYRSFAVHLRDHHPCKHNRRTYPRLRRRFAFSTRELHSGIEIVA